jgi:hypothetical protein
MDRTTAEHWVVISALIVAAVYGYRRLIEPVQQGNIKNIIGIGNPVPLAQWATAWGVVYLVISVMAEASPGLGGSFAILIATGDLLVNIGSVTADVQKQETSKTASAVGANVGQGVNNVTSVAANVGQGVSAGVAGSVAQNVGAGVGATTGVDQPGSGIGHR